MAIHVDYQGLGIGAALLRQVLKDDFLRGMSDIHMPVPLPPAPYVVFRTQNPMMKYCFDKAVGVETYPRVNDDSVPSDIAHVSQVVAKNLGDDHFDPLTMTTRGIYGHSLYGQPPSPPNDDYGRLFGRINAAAGDAFVCVWRRQTAH